MNKTYLGLSILLAFTLITGVTLAEDAAAEDPVLDAENGAIDLNATATSDEGVADQNATEEESGVEGDVEGDVEDDADTLAENETDSEAVPETEAVPEAEAAPEAMDLNYIWSLTLGAEQISMVLNQDGEEVYGQAKPTSGEPYNALIVGSLDENEVMLVMSALVDDTLVSTLMVGTYENEAITGTYQKYDATGNIDSGDFSAIWINPNKADYTPAEIAKEEPAAAVTSPEETAPQAVSLGSDDTSRFVDVRKYKDQVGPAGLIPPGMA